MRAFRVRLPSGRAYWTVIDDDLAVVPAVDGFLQHLRLGRDLAESTTKAYAGALALYLVWCQRTGRDWKAADRLGSFITWLQHMPSRSTTSSVLPGPGSPVVRGARRVNFVLTAVREFLKHGVTMGTAGAEVLTRLYEIHDGRHLPAEVRGEGSGLRYYAKARHRLHEPEQAVKAATDTEIVALLAACRSARDRFIVLALARTGLRRGELTGLRLEDLHFVVDATHLGCPVPGAHLHVRWRDNPNRAAAKSRRSRAVPVDHLLVQAYDLYCLERDCCPAAADCDFVLVNLFRAPLGAPMRPGALNEVFAGLSRRASLERPVHPHQLRHSFGTNLTAAGGSLDEAQELLGHAQPSSTGIYLHPSYARLRAAVDRVAAPSQAQASRQAEGDGDDGSG
jgi:integrase/recombinase XerD